MIRDILRDITPKRFHYKITMALELIVDKKVDFVQSKNLFKNIISGIKPEEALQILLKPVTINYGKILFNTIILACAFGIIGAVLFEER